MKRLSAILAMLILVGCVAATHAEISEQFHVTVDRNYSRVLWIHRLQGGAFTVQTGFWTAKYSPGWGTKSEDTLVTVVRSWIKKVWNIDTPEEEILIGDDLQGFNPPETEYSFPVTPIYSIRTGVRSISICWPDTTTDTSVVLYNLDQWIDGLWDIDRGDEREWFRDTINVEPPE